MRYVECERRRKFRCPYKSSFSVPLFRIARLRNPRLRVRRRTTHGPDPYRTESASHGVQLSKNAFRDHRTTCSKSSGSLHRNELGRSQPGFRHLRRFRPRDPAVVVQVPRRDNQVRAFSLGAGDVAVVVRIRFRGGFGHFYGDGFELARDAARVLNGEWTLVRAKRRFRCVSKRISFVSQKSVHRAQRVNTDPEATSRVGQSTGAARDEKKCFFSVLQSRWFLSPCNSRTQHTVSPNRHAAVGSQPGERRRRVV